MTRLLLFLWAHITGVMGTQKAFLALHVMVLHDHEGKI
jgi:hypothetical protein